MERAILNDLIDKQYLDRVILYDLVILFDLLISSVKIELNCVIWLLY